MAHLFRKQSANYALFRPDYPPALFETILSYLGRGPRSLAVDVATGTGQAAIPLTRLFKRVVAIDGSENQIQQLKQLMSSSSIDNMEVKLGSAEDLPLAKGSADLITTAQALHWFNRDKFINCAYSALRPGGVLAIWGYTLPRLQNRAISNIVKELYADTLGKYWDERRRLVDAEYSGLDPTVPPWAAVKRSGHQ